MRTRRSISSSEKTRQDLDVLVFTTDAPAARLAEDHDPNRFVMVATDGTVPSGRELRHAE